MDTDKRDRLMIYQAKRVIKKIISQDINYIVAELIGNSFYFNNSEYFYKFFGLQGGTVYQLAVYIKQYNNKMEVI